VRSRYFATVRSVCSVGVRRSFVLMVLSLSGDVVFRDLVETTFFRLVGRSRPRSASSMAVAVV